MLDMKRQENGRQNLIFRSGKMEILTGPFVQLLTLGNLPLRGPILDEQLVIIENAGILSTGGIISAIGNFVSLRTQFPEATIDLIEGVHIALPGFIDAHTHLVFSGTRAADYSLRIAGRTYQQIAASGGGIWNSVSNTRKASDDDLLRLLLQRLEVQNTGGITTTEIKTGYGLTVAQELRMLKLIEKGKSLAFQDIITTCLAAHIKPLDFLGNSDAYLTYLINELLPLIRFESSCKRVDIFIEEGAFSSSEGRIYLQAASKLGFEFSVHADQFTCGGSRLAVELQARSADHLEASSQVEIDLLGRSKTAAIVLPGASMGLGMEYAQARSLLDAGASLVIASDHNPGSAPMGNLLMQASVLGAAEKLTAAETFAALTFRAGAALGLIDRGRIEKGCLADFQAYSINDYREILYNQGMLKPVILWKRGVRKQLHL